LISLQVLRSSATEVFLAHTGAIQIRLLLLLLLLSLSSWQPWFSN